MLALETLKIKFEKSACWIRFNRSECKNTINHKLVRECRMVIENCIEKHCKIIIFEGSKEYFCFGADFEEQKDNGKIAADLYELWQTLLYGPFISIAHVQGQVNAGGMGFVSSCDLVITNKSATFGFSELLFGLYPAMVLPFLINRIGVSKAKILALMVKTISAIEAKSCGLIDDSSEDSDRLLRKYLVRLEKLPLNGVIDYKTYMYEISNVVIEAKEKAIQNNIRMFKDPLNVKRIIEFVEKGVYPWERF